MYKCVDGVIMPMTPEEIAEMEKLAQQQAEYDKNRPPSLEEEVANLKKDNETLTQCILEMSTLVYK